MKDNIAASITHPKLGKISAWVPILGHALASGDISNWIIIQGDANPAIQYGSIIDMRTDYGEPASIIAPDDSDATPYEAYDEYGNFLSAYHSFDHAMEAIGNHYQDNIDHPVIGKLCDKK